MELRTLLQEAEVMQPEILADRRALHRNPETGAELPETAAYVKRRLEALGYAPRMLAGGVAAEITGEKTGRCILLRADMDALRIREETALDFRSENGNMHACGHDLHAAMLLGAAGLLRKHQAGVGKARCGWCSSRTRRASPARRPCWPRGFCGRRRRPQAAVALHVQFRHPVGAGAVRPGHVYGGRAPSSA